MYIKIQEENYIKNKNELKYVLDNKEYIKNKINLYIENDEYKEYIKENIKNDTIMYIYHTALKNTLLKTKDIHNYNTDNRTNVHFYIKMYIEDAQKVLTILDFKSKKNKILKTYPDSTDIINNIYCVPNSLPDLIAENGVGLEMQTIIKDYPLYMFKETKIKNLQKMKSKNFILIKIINAKNTTEIYKYLDINTIIKHKKEIEDEHIKERWGNKDICCVPSYLASTYSLVS